jgi:hypothetical protein
MVLRPSTGKGHLHQPGKSFRAPYLQALRVQLGDSSVEAGLAKGAELDWDATVQELLQECMHPDFPS